MRIKYLLIFLCAALATWTHLSCGSLEKPVLYIPTAADTLLYTASDSDFANPERGFYRPLETHAGQYEALDANQLKTWRTLQKADGGAVYSIYSTLVLREFVLEGFNAIPLSQDLLDKIKTDFAAARTAGVKLIVRFNYTTTTHAGSCPESFACPPYGDASKATILGHIAQLKPLLQDNADIIACMQMGLIGIWGEGYYTDYFGDASSNDQGQLYDNNWQDRNAILKALLDALPAGRMIQVRYPQLKQRYVYGVEAPTSSAALTEAEAFSGSDKARIGMHNDCFLSGVGDYGTYDDYGNSSSSRGSAFSVLHAYAAADDQFVVTGGETCDDTYSPENDCETAGMAQTEMRSLHYSFLNSAYNNDVNNDWVSGNCMENIKKDLGYRFVLTKGLFPASAITSGMQFKFTLHLVNEGYASPYNQRPLRLILRSRNGGKEYSFDLAADPRRWYTGLNTFTETIPTAGLPTGQYDTFLYLPDAASSIAARPEYAIRLANKGVWDPVTGYNALNKTISIQ